MRILVTGAGGLMGSYLTCALLAKGFDVVGAVWKKHLPIEAFKTGPGKLSLIEGDLVDGLELCGPFDAVVHTASTLTINGHLPVSKHVLTNTIATSKLIEQAIAQKVKRFLFFSSVSVYGEVVDDEIDENTPIRNPDVYGMSKHLAERALKEASEDLPSISLRIPGIIGPGAHGSWLPRCVDAMKRDKPVKAYNLSSPFNNAVHMKDISRFIIDLVHSDFRGHDAVTLAAAGYTTVADALKRLIHGLNSLSEIVEQNSAQKSFVISIAKAQRRYGYAPMEINALLDQFTRESHEETIRKEA